MRWLLVVLACLWVSPAWSQAVQYQSALGQQGTTPVSPQSPMPVTAVGGGAGSITPVAPSGSLTLTSGGTSQTLFTAGEVAHGCTIQNPSTATEAIFVDFTGAAAVTTSGGTSIQVPIGSSIPCGAGITTAVKWIAATTSHAINAVKF
jgi:hypothetical protein